MTVVGGHIAESGVLQQVVGGRDAKPHPLGEVGVGAHGDELTAQGAIALQNGAPGLHGLAAIGVQLNAASGLYHPAQHGVNAVPPGVQGDFLGHIAQRIDDVSQDIIGLRQLHQAEHGGEIVVQYPAAGLLRVIGEVEEVLSAQLGREIVERADHKVQLGQGEHAPGVVGIKGGASVFDAEPELEFPLKGGRRRPELLQGRGPVIIGGKAAVLQNAVIVVGDAQLGESGLLRGAGHFSQGHMPVGGESGVGVIVDEIHTARSNLSDWPGGKPLKKV